MAQKQDMLAARKSGGVKEFVRKKIVALKRNPSVIPLVVMVVSFLYFSLNLTVVSNTTAKIQGSGMGLCQFSVTLLSILNMVCMLNAFPRRKKANVPMVALMFVMFAVMIYADYHYIGRITAAMTRELSPIVIDAGTQYIADAKRMLSHHSVLVIVSAVLVATLPIYSKWLRKIKTSIQVEDNGEMAAIELEE